MVVPADPVLDQRVLANGLRVLTTPMPHSRSVTVSFYFGAGSRYEDPAEAGISHLVEHCCFKGSARWPTAPEISAVIEGVGGVLNAGTDREFTVYYAKVPRDHVDLALEVLADIVLRPLFDPAELEKERDVILEELAMVEDNPGQLAEVVLDALLWPGQALGRDVAGTPETVRAIPRDRAVAYRHAQYAPHNARRLHRRSDRPRRRHRGGRALHGRLGARRPWSARQLPSAAGGRAARALARQAL